MVGSKSTVEGAGQTRFNIMAISGYEVGHGTVEESG